MMFGVAKRVLVGRPMQSERLGHTLLPKRIALPVFASAALSSVASAPDQILIAVLVVAVVGLMNMRGVRESGTVCAIPAYCFIGAVVLMIVWGVTRLGLGHHLHADSAGYRIPPAHHYTGLLLVFLLLRAFSSGCTALTGVEAISNGRPAFQKPKSKNPSTTLALLRVIAVSMFAGVTALALVSHVHMCPSATDCLPHVTTQR